MQQVLGGAHTSASPRHRALPRGEGAPPAALPAASPPRSLEWSVLLRPTPTASSLELCVVLRQQPPGLGASLGWGCLAPPGSSVCVPFLRGEAFLQAMEEEGGREGQQRQACSGHCQRLPGGDPCVPHTLKDATPAVRVAERGGARVDARLPGTALALGAVSLPSCLLLPPSVSFLPFSLSVNKPLWHHSDRFAFSPQSCGGIPSVWTSAAERGPGAPCRSSTTPSR